MNETPEKIIYFVRHGQSEGNVMPIFQPLNSTLNDVGKKQAELIAERIAKLSFETLIASPLMRARETAEVISEKTSKKPELSDLFVERVKPSKLMGKSYEDEGAEKLWNEWNQSLYTSGLRVEDGENFADLVIRADRALDFLKQRPEKALVVVTHGFFLKTLIARVVLGEVLTPASFKNFQLRILTENTGLTVLKYNETLEGTGWRLWIYNDHAHLG